MAQNTQERFINRELSWLSFNERVLQEAKDASNPLIERMRFLGIFSNNMDEFFRVRVASLNRLSKLGKRVTTGLEFEPEETLSEIREKVMALQTEYQDIFDQLELELRAENISFIDEHDLNEEQRAFAEQYFADNIRPSLVPIMISTKRGFPELGDDAVYLAVRMVLEGENGTKFKHAIIELPKHISRFVVLPKEGDNNYVMFAEDVIRLKLERIFTIFQASDVEAYTFKITRDAELDIDDDISKSLMEKMSTSLDRRKRGEYVRFVYDEAMPEDMLQYFLKKMDIKDRQELIPGRRYHNKKDLMGFPSFGRKDLCFEPLPPLAHKHLQGKKNILQEIKKRDILLHYPYQRFSYIVDLLREAAIDPHVRSIRINLYRVASNSQIINALVNAAKNGKKVIVVVELQARFDEENNINVSEVLQDAGVKVIFGVPGLKVHSKLILISRKEKGKSERIAHIGTGNFHEKTARIYGDLSLLTADKRITSECRKLFSFFENNYERGIYRHLLVSPYNNRRKLMAQIQKEIKNAQAGEKAWIILKINNLVDAGMIQKLYRASNAGVNVRLIVRGVCSLIPGVKGMSENISVTSIVGRFLEHARIFAFCNGGEPKYYISSADWMTRNLDHRIEVTVPIYDIKLQSEITEYLNLQFKDNVKTRIIDEKQSNSYLSASRSRGLVNSQLAVYEYYKAKLKKGK
jgi:polyphosphate kinase